MYCTTDPRLIEKEIETAKRVIEKYDGREDLRMAQQDALSAAKATINTYGDLADENVKVAEYRPVAS